MKTMRKLFALVLAMTMVFAMAVTAGAAVTVDKALPGSTYNAYLVATAAINDSTGSVVYYSETGWVDFWNSESEIYTGLTVGDLFDLTEVDGKQVLSKTDKITTENQEVVMAAVARAAKEYAEGKPIAAVETVEAGEGENVSVTLNRLTQEGYYLLTSSKGSLCTLTTVDKNTTSIKEKNGDLPKVTKTINDTEVQIGDTVTFTLSVTAGDNINNEMNYIIHDTMGDGLTLDENTIKVELSPLGSTSVTTLVQNTDYTINKACTDGCTFAIEFVGLTTAAGDTITVTYNATVNANAIDNDSITNTAGIDDSTSKVEPKTKEFSLTKTDDNSNTLDGAEFKLYYAATDDSGDTNYVEVPVVAVMDTNDNTKVAYYRPAVTGETGVTIVAGTATVKGLASDMTYFVKETKAPEGYVMITNYASVALGNEVNKIINTKGETLPETGGMGTTLFYIIGGLMVVSAAVLLVVKKRMTAE